MSETYFTHFYLLLVELIDLVNPVIIVLPQGALLKWPSDTSVLSKKVFVIILRDLLWEDIFKLSASAAREYEWVQVGVDVYIPPLKYLIQVSESK